MILALEPHTDDVCLAAGGYLSWAKEGGFDTSVLAFSTGNDKTGSNSREFAAAMKALNVTEWRILDHPPHSYYETRQAILERIEWAIDFWAVDELIIPALHDHQDHRTVHEEAIRACRMREIDILAYGQPWSQMMTPFVPNYYVELEYRHMVQKLYALKAFKSQQDKPYMDENFTIACALYHGINVRGRFAEAFEVIRWGA